jgi:acylphosphatase
MPKGSLQPIATEHFAIRGDVGDAHFVPWINRHAARLGLEGRVLGQSRTCVEVILTGPPELLDAMALGCSLGPREVWVDGIERVPGNSVSPDLSPSPCA